MAKKILPKCFISYCHENADHPTIDAFQDNIEKIASGSFQILRDKSNVLAGGHISDHENEIEKSAIVIILCTPSYKRKVLERASGGVYREYGKILARYNNYILALKSGKSVPTFSVLPILFSGTHETSMLDDFADNLYLDFTKYRTVKPPRGPHEVPNFVKSSHTDLFEKIRSKFENVGNGLDHSFKENYIDWLDLLFAQEKHEVLRKKYKLKNKEADLDELFVKTTSFNRIAGGDKCILIGRKGSGKSTIVDQFHRSNSDQYKSPIHVIVDNFDLGFLYNILFSGKHASDIEKVVRIENYFEAVWKIYIYSLCAQTLLEEFKNGTATIDLEPYAKTITENMSFAESRWAQFTETCDQTKQYIDKVISRAPNKKNFYSEIASNIEIKSIVEGVLNRELISCLQEAAYNCNKKFVFALDGFDQRFEDFRFNSLASSLDDEDRKRRIKFEVSWLKGLLRTTLDLRSADSILQDNIDFCITIPQDRFMEVRETERDDYRFRALAANLQWSGVELSILIRKRLESLSAFQSNKALAPEERLEEILQCEDINLPLRIQMNVDGNVLSMSTFKYLLRHTFWRPRDIIFYLAAILANKNVLEKRNAEISEGLFKEIISRTTYDVIETEFIREFQNNVTNIKDIIHLFEEMPIILDFGLVDKIVSRDKFYVNGGTIPIDNTLNKIDYLFQMGFLGVELSEKRRRGENQCKDMFVFSDGDKKYSAISDNQKKKLNYVIHPIFVEYLTLDTKVGRIVCQYSDEYIKRNDILRA